MKYGIMYKLSDDDPWQLSKVPRAPLGEMKHILCSLICTLADHGIYPAVRIVEMPE